MTTKEGGSLADPEVNPGLERQVANDNDYLVKLRTNYVKSLVPQIVVPNSAWMGQAPRLETIPVSSTEHSNAWSRSIHQSHAFRDKQIFYGN
jgi:hypothetical protein